jgi:hypothetical protein
MSRPLERVQAAFAAALDDPGAVAAFVPALVTRDLLTAERLALYRGNVVAAWEKALANSYPVVRALVGDEFFAALARAYGRAHPSVSGDLNRFGDYFAKFVAAFEHTQSLPYLGDVAALEWAVHRAHYAADGNKLTRERVAALPPIELLSARFGLDAACACIASRFPVARIWQAHQPRSQVALPESLDSGEFALVVRPCWRVEVLVSSAGEIAALERLCSGADVESAIAAGLGVDAGFDFPRALVRWLDFGMLVDDRTGEGGAG